MVEILYILLVIVSVIGYAALISLLLHVNRTLESIDNQLTNANDGRRHYFEQALEGQKTIDASIVETKHELQQLLKQEQPVKKSGSANFIQQSMEEAYRRMNQDNIGGDE